MKKKPIVLNVLIVEDDEGLMNYLSKIITEVGGEVFVAKNGKEALKVLKTIDIDVIITDLIMPEMEGIELINVLKSERKSSAKIIAISGNDTSYLIMAKKLGADLILEKPFEPEELLELIRSL